MSVAAVPLGELMPPKKRSVDPRKSPDEEFELFSIPAFDEGAPEVISGKDIGSSKQILERGDVLLSKIVPHIRRAWVVEPTSERTTIGSSEWIIFRSDRFEPAYLRHALVSDRFHQAYMQTVAGVGGSLLRARPSYVAEIGIPLPSMEEQRRIAAVLDAAEALRAKRRRALTKLDSLTQAIFADMFSGESFELVALGDLGEFKYGTSEKAAATGIATLRIPNVVGGEISYEDIKQVLVTEEELSRLQLVDGDLLFVRSNGNPDYVGRSAVFSQRDADHAGFAEPVIFASYLIRARLRQELANSTYASAYLNGSKGRRALRRRCKTSAGQYNINTQGLGSVQLPLPPIPMQHEFSQRTRLVRHRVEACHQQLGQFDALFSSLQQRAFQGEL